MFTIHFGGTVPLFLENSHIQKCCRRIFQLQELDPTITTAEKKKLSDVWRGYESEAEIMSLNDGLKKKDAENTRRIPWLFRGFVGDGKLPSYIGITIDQWKVGGFFSWLNWLNFTPVN